MTADGQNLAFHNPKFGKPVNLYIFLFLITLPGTIICIVLFYLTSQVCGRVQQALRVVYTIALDEPPEPGVVQHFDSNAFCDVFTVEVRIIIPGPDVDDGNDGFEGAVVRGSRLYSLLAHKLIPNDVQIGLSAKERWS